MVFGGRRKSAFVYIALGAGLISVILVLYVGWVLLNWRTGILLFLGILLLAVIISGVVLNTIFLVREIRRNEQHDAFINAVTHELKTPIASIRLYIETLQSRTVDDAKREEFYRTMLADSERLLSTIDQILRTGRIGHARRKLNVSEIEIHALIEECLARTHTLHHLPADSIVYRRGPSAVVRGDLDEVRSAITNLFDNAVKYSGKRAQVEVEVERMDGKYVSIRVKDQGPGIPKKDLKRIFKRFYRVPGPIARRVPGTGLGLFIVRSVAKAHGGRVWAESEGPGRGSTFVLQLPVEQ